jgi:hypothetical protein
MSGLFRIVEGIVALRGLKPDGTLALLKATQDGILRVAPGGGARLKAFLENGGSNDLLVDGSGTPVNFTFDADPTLDVYLNTLSLFLLCQPLTFNGSAFGGGAGLTNGIRIAYTSGGSETLIGTLKTNSAMYGFSDAPPSLETNLPANDILQISINLGGEVLLEAGSSDKLEVRIQDDLDRADLIVFTATVNATKATS